MKLIHRFAWLRKCLLVPILVLTIVPVCYSAPLYSGNTNGTFANAAKTGVFVDWLRFPFRFEDNNAADAVVTGEGTNFLTWGFNPNPLPPGVAPFSSVLFTGNPAFGPVAENERFFIGAVTYTNGTILAGTGTYGATLTINANDPLNVINPLVKTYTNIDTINYVIPTPIPDPFKPLFPGFANIGEVLSADGIVLPGAEPPFALVKEGKQKTFNLFGKIVGDPDLIFVDIQVDPGSVGDAAVVPFSVVQSIAATIPEPSTLTLLIIGILGLALYACRRRKQAA